MLIKYPVENKTISQPFGFDNTNHPLRKDFYLLFDHKHPGVDFSVPIGTSIFASFSGIVVRNENHVGMGNVVGIRNGNIVALYAHLSESSVTLGEVIEEGSLIGFSGDTGNACTAPHLHFELRDITKPSLKEMVFDPPFDQEPLCFSDTFKYIVNNKNTQKTLKFLSQMYFGTEDKWQDLKDFNNLDFDGDKNLQDGEEVMIPNY